MALTDPTLDLMRVGCKRSGENSTMATKLSAERAAHNECVFRDANERIEQRLEELSSLEDRSPFLCECQDPLCVSPVWLTVEEYEAVRAHSTRFFVVRDHEDDGEVIARRDGYDLIEKHGIEGGVAAALDPRT
jgi:hypothetical protein